VKEQAEDEHATAEAVAERRAGRERHHEGSV
jgi:hypothetical protein